MAFSFVVLGRMPCLPPNKRYAEAARLEEAWGTYTNTSGSTGGVIDPECDNVLYANAIDESGANAIRVQTDQGSDGLFTITTTADSDGRWRALLGHNKA